MDDLKQQLFASIYPCGISYADTAIEKNGDYLQVAFLSYRTLELKVYVKKSPLLPFILEHAKTLQDRKGEKFQISTCGQTVTLGE